MPWHLRRATPPRPGARVARRAVLAAVLVAVVGLAGCTAAPPEERAPLPRVQETWPAWEVDDAWVWAYRAVDTRGGVENGTIRGVVTAVLDDRYVVRTADDQGEETLELWRDNLTIVNTSDRALDLPLFVGKTWTRGSYLVRVVAEEEVETPAGTFQAWHVNQTARPGRPVAWQDEWWSPEAKIWVRSVQVRVFAGAPLVVERELQEVRLASGGS